MSQSLTLYFGGIQIEKYRALKVWSVAMLNAIAAVLREICDQMAKELHKHMEFLLVVFYEKLQVSLATAAFFLAAAVAVGP